MSRPLRVALFGYGISARRFHVPLIHAADGIELKGIVTRSPQRYQEASLHNTETRVFRSEKSFWSSASDFDMSVIATSNQSHMSLATKSLLHGLHVVVEKPVAGTARDASSLLRLSSQVGKQVHVFHNRRWDSDFLTLRRLFESGTIGEGLILESRMESQRELVRTSWRNSKDPRDLGGVLLDLGSHLVDQALQILGPVQSVFSTMHAVRDESTPDDHVNLVLTHENNAVSLLVMSRTSDMTGSRFKLLGSKGSIEIVHCDSQEQMLRLGIDPGSPEWGREPEHAYALLHSRNPTGSTSSRNCAFTRGQWPFFYRQVVEAVVGGCPAPVGLEDAVQNMRVLDAARKSARLNRVVRINPAASHLFQSKPC